MSSLRLNALGVLPSVLIALAMVWLGAKTGRAADLTLYMVEQPGCIYCAQWNAEVGDAYAVTAEGKAAPLVRIDLHAPRPAGVTFARNPQFTPTFILVQSGVERGRIEGYPGEDFFWGLLGVMLKEAGVALSVP